MASAGWTLGCCGLAKEVDAGAAARGVPADQLLLNQSDEDPCEELARGPVGIPFEAGETGGIVGEALGATGVGTAPLQDETASCRRSAKEPPRPPLGCEEPREGGTYPRGPAGGARVLAWSGRLCADIDAGALGSFAGGDLEGAEKLRVALGPVGGILDAAGPRGGDRGLGDRGGSRCGFVRTGERSLGVDLDDSL